MWQELISLFKKKNKEEINRRNNSQSSDFQDICQNTIKFSKKFEENLLNNQNKLLIEEISRQYLLFFDINQKYIDFLDANEKQIISKIMDLKSISIKKETKPSLIDVINQNNQIDAIFKKIDHEKSDSLKKIYLKSFFTEKMNHFVIDDILKDYINKDESEDALTRSNKALSEL